MNTNSLLQEAMQLKATADIGLLYNTNPYDRERYEAIRETSLRLMALAGSHDLQTINDSFLPVTDYPTAKVDIRALILSPGGEILLAKESADERWSLPGGWADVGGSPAENIVKEFREETGLEVIPERLLAVFDKAKHPHPPQAEYVYKMVFLCKAFTHTIKPGFDVLDVQFFSLDNLPPLSENRILKSQIELAYQLAQDDNSKTYFD
ncbi:MAG TPA: NUDIX hydrolase [Flavisolibacter sp.]|nr:NUDIX hydrolase [Flavisolibacter sp.]